MHVDRRTRRTWNTYLRKGIHAAKHLHAGHAVLDRRHNVAVAVAARRACHSEVLQTAKRSTSQTSGCPPRLTKTTLALKAAVVGAHPAHKRDSARQRIIAYGEHS